MNWRTNFKFRSDKTSDRTSSTSSQVDSGGTGFSQDRSARLFPELEKPEQKPKKKLRLRKDNSSSYVFTHKHDEYANDDSTKQASSLRAVMTVTMALILTIMLINMQAIITQLVMRADPRVLETVMEVSPDAAAYALNQMDVGG